MRISIMFFVLKSSRFSGEKIKKNMLLIEDFIIIIAIAVILNLILPSWLYLSLIFIILFITFKK